MLGNYFIALQLPAYNTYHNTRILIHKSIIPKMKNKFYTTQNIKRTLFYNNEIILHTLEYQDKHKSHPSLDILVAAMNLQNSNDHKYYISGSLHSLNMDHPAMYSIKNPGIDDHPQTAHIYHNDENDPSMRCQRTIAC